MEKIDEAPKIGLTCRPLCLAVNKDRVYYPRSAYSLKMSEFSTNKHTLVNCVTHLASTLRLPPILLYFPYDQRVKKRWHRAVQVPCGDVKQSTRDPNAPRLRVRFDLNAVLLTASQRDGGYTCYERLRRLMVILRSSSGRSRCDPFTQAMGKCLFFGPEQL